MSELSTGEVLSGLSEDVLRQCLITARERVAAATGTLKQARTYLEQVWEALVECPEVWVPFEPPGHCLSCFTFRAPLPDASVVLVDGVPVSWEPERNQRQVRLHSTPEAGQRVWAVVPQESAQEAQETENSPAEV